MRRSPRCVTTPISNTQNLVTKYAILAMNLPFRNELSDILGITDSDQVTEERVDEALVRHREELTQRRRHMADNFAERVAEILVSVQQQPSAAAAPHSDDLPDAFHERELLQAMEVDSTAAPISVISHIRDEEDDLAAFIPQLSQEQTLVLKEVQSYLRQVDDFNSAMQTWKRTKEVAEVFAGTEVPPEPTAPTPPRLIVLGPGGTGKSFLIRVLVLTIRQWAKVRSATRPSPQQGVVLAAPTGIAAFNIGGSTIHSAFSLKVEKNGYSTFEKLRQLPLANFKEKFKNVQLVVIDEVSMVGARVLSQIHQRLNQAMDVPNGFFGNIGVILLGDLLQLPPVRATTIFATDDIDAKDLTIVPNRLHLYRSLFKPIFLTVPQRQKGDQAFAQLLLRAREGQLTPEDDVTLNHRSLSQTNPNRAQILALLETEFAGATWLYPRKVDVGAHNWREITRLTTATGHPLFTFSALDEGKITVPKEADLDATGGLPSEITLTKGASVMLRHNIDVADGLYNGAQGTIALIDGDPNSTTPRPIYVHFGDPKIGTKAARREVDGKMAVRIDPKTASFDLNGRQVKRTQLPVILSFAITIHKAQGLTLQKVVADCGEKVFAPGMAYTAASRVRRLEDLILSDFTPHSFRVNDLALQEIERLKGIL